MDGVGGRWATACELHAGDVIIQHIFILHASLTNMSNRSRISCETHYQRKDQPADDRWAGDTPRGHDRFCQAAEQLGPVEVSRERWGV